MLKKIQFYIFIQIFKSCTLVFFIFVSIAWLLQISRLFNFLSNFQVKFLDTLYLSLFLLPNLINVVFPFIIIFAFVISFIKFDRDKELIAIFSLGIPLKEIQKTILIFLLLISFIYILLNLFISPYVYNKYKQKEFDLRNLIDLQNINISNFLEIDENLILDFTKENNKFKDVFLNYKQKNENIIYASEAKIIQNEKELIFNLVNGFKIEFIKNKIEKLEFSDYNFYIPIQNIKTYNNVDNNTLTIINLIKNKKYKIILEKIIESIIIFIIILLFFYNNIKPNNYRLFKIFIFISISILMLIINNLIKNLEIHNQLYIILNILNILFVSIYILIIKLINEKN